MRTARSPKNWGISLENLQDLAEVRIIELGELVNMENFCQFLIESQ